MQIQILEGCWFPYFVKPYSRAIPGRFLPLAVRAEMGAAPGQQDAANGGSAGEAGLAGPHIDAVFELEKPGHSVGVHVIGDGRPSQLDRVA